MPATEKISVTIGRKGVSQRPHEVVYTSDLAELEALLEGVPQFSSIRIERA